MSSLHKRFSITQQLSGKVASRVQHYSHRTKKAHQTTPTHLIFLLICSSIVALIWIGHFIDALWNPTFDTDDGYIEKMRNAVEMTRALNQLSSSGQSIHRVQPHKYRVVEGDTSEEYALLRKKYDALLPSHDIERIKTFVSTLSKNTYTTARPNDLSYDIYNCPDQPPAGYPYSWNIMSVLENWKPEDTTPHEHIYQGICLFDFERDYNKARNYRNAEVPFVIRNDPDILQTVERWNQPGYLDSLLGNPQYMVELSKTNKYMYWNKPKKISTKDRAETFVLDDTWEPPTSMVRMEYKDWLHKANVTDPLLTGYQSPHYYLRLIGCGKLGRECDSTPAEFLFNELTFFTFKPDRDSLYIVDPHGQRGIHCRFGMKGIIIANHYDASRNSIVVLGGQRRYILAHPSQCKFLDLLPPGHPSARHSAVDWTHPDLDAHPNFVHAKVTELVLQAGDLLYLPTNWFHYIVNLDLNVQCNTRSGKSNTYDKLLSACGFSDLLRGT